MVLNAYITLIHILLFASVLYLQRGRALTNAHTTCCNRNAHSVTRMLRLGRLCAKMNALRSRSVSCRCANVPAGITAIGSL
jgi:hypothetical protein